MDVKKSPPWTYRVTIPTCISITKRAMFACVSDNVFPFCSSSGRSVSRSTSLSPRLLQNVHLSLASCQTATRTENWCCCLTGKGCETYQVTGRWAGPKVSVSASRQGTSEGGTARRTLGSRVSKVCQSTWSSMRAICCPGRRESHAQS